MKDGIEVGMKDGAALGSKLGPALGINVGSKLGKLDGLTLCGQFPKNDIDSDPVEN